MNRKCIIVFIFMFVFLGASNAFGQELRRKQRWSGLFKEEFFVLKNDKQVRQGPYFKYRKDIFKRMIPVAFGHYIDNERTGRWYFFYSRGPLESFGNYVDGKREGEWREYHMLELPVKETMDDLMGLPTTLKVEDDGKVTIEKDERKLSAVGNYRDDRKTGIWKYYFRGILLHKYDYSSHQLVYSALPDSSNQNCPYLGGMARFFNQFHSVEYDWIPEAIDEDSWVEMRIDIHTKPITIQVVSQRGDKSLAAHLKKVIEHVPDDWIPSLVDKPLYFTSEVVMIDGTASRIYSMSYHHFVHRAKRLKQAHRINLK
jgi:hypothetical protein